MHKKYIVRLSDEERGICQQMIKHLKGSSQKFRRAQILLKADADASGWSDVKIAEAFDCRVQTIEHVRKRLVTEGFDLAATPGTAHASQARWRGGSAVACHALGEAAGGVRTLDAPTARRCTGGFG